MFSGLTLNCVLLLLQLLLASKSGPGPFQLEDYFRVQGKDTRMVIVMLLVIAFGWKQPKCPKMGDQGSILDISMIQAVNLIDQPHIDCWLSQCYRENQSK